MKVNGNAAKLVKEALESGSIENLVDVAGSIDATIKQMEKPLKEAKGALLALYQTGKLAAGKEFQMQVKESKPRSTDAAALFKLMKKEGFKPEEAFALMDVRVTDTVKLLGTASLEEITTYPTTKLALGFKPV